MRLMDSKKQLGSDAAQPKKGSGGWIRQKPQTQSQNKQVKPAEQAAKKNVKSQHGQNSGEVKTQAKNRAPQENKPAQARPNPFAARAKIQNPQATQAVSPKNNERSVKPQRPQQNALQQNSHAENKANSTKRPQSTEQENKSALARSPDRRQENRRSSSDRRLNELRLAPGEFIFKEGEKSEFGYVVVSGSVEICKMINGEYRALSELEPGALFGEMAIIDGGERSASARAKDDALVREIDEAELKTYFTRSPDVALDIMRRLSQYVRSSNQALEVSVFDAPSTQNESKIVEEDLSDKAKLLAASKDNQYIIDEFQNPTNALIKSRMPPIVHRTFIAIALLCCIFIFWASYSIIDTTLSAPGKLTTTVPKITVQSGSGGTIKSVLVKPGQEIKVGDVLATLDQTLVEADYNKLRRSNEHIQDKIDRLELEIKHAPLSAAQALDSVSEKASYRLRWEEHNSKLKTLEIELQKVKSALNTAKSNINIGEIKVKEVQHEFNKQQRLVNENILSETALNEAQFKLDKARAELRNSKDSLQVAERNYETSLMESKKYRTSRNRELNDELYTAIKQLEADKEEMIKIEHQRDNTEILSPVDGVVLEVDGLFVGAVVNTGQVVTTLVPTNVPLTVEMDIDPKNISNLTLGNEVSIKLSALPYQKHGDLSGKVTFISEDTVDESITGEPGTFYRARADIASNNLTKLPADFNLVPGMQLNGDIRVGKRRLITYFLYPVIRTLDTSFQEP